MSGEIKNVSDKSPSLSSRNEILIPVVVETSTSEIACTSVDDIPESSADASNRPHANNELMMSEKISNVSDKVPSSSSCDEILVPEEMETGTGELACTSAADISESIKDISNHLQAIAAHINRHGQTHKEDCFSIRRSDECLPSIEMIPKSLETIKTVFNADIQPNTGRAEFFYSVPSYMSPK